MLDSSLPLMTLVGLTAPTDPRWLSRLDAIGSELVTDSLVHCDNPDTAPDALDANEGTFSIGTFRVRPSAHARRTRRKSCRWALSARISFGERIERI